ncbi:bifunctional BTB-POZ domain/SKP1-BTB-POZ domain superfamily [Babesia duncani]|uniref:Bifunctional BTB-POZ domain/SKP1-BTB-POZ domain superfamily n=1 Tax=Babesia duncani TaxID=323732 RepID=A0AAD9PJY8_9APIC|nr:bifunctional BTB-POZ domain/SKP1-BTB-POZ domain superfamily [Babesia duncani]
MMREGCVTVNLSDITERKDIRDEYTDMFLILRQTDNTDENQSDVVINVHSGVLRVASPYFMRSLDELEAKIRSNGIERSKLEYVLTTPYPRIIQRILRYIYSNDYFNIKEPPEDLVPLYQECVRLELNELKTSVLKIIQFQSSLEIISKLGGVADACHETTLAQDCGRILADAAFGVFSAELHLNLGISGLIAMLRCDNIQLDEVQIFAALCHYMEAKKDLHTPFGITQIGEIEQDLLHHIRFCSMAPKSLKEFKSPNLDALLLDATLRILLKNHFPPRCFPWISNEHYEIRYFQGLFPIMLVRTLSHGNCNDSRDAVGSHAYTFGVERELSVGYWAFQVAKTHAGNMGFGIVFRSTSVDCDNPINAALQMRSVYYVDFGDKAVKCGNLGPGYKLRSANDFESLSMEHRLEQNDIVVVKINVHMSNINLTISVLDTDFSKELCIPFTCDVSVVFFYF